MFNFGGLVELDSPDKQHQIGFNVPQSPDSEAVQITQGRRRPQIGLQIDPDSQDGDEGYDRDSDGQNSPELIIPKRGPR